MNWRQPFGFHERCGNGNQLQNVGLVMVSILAGFQIRDGFEKIIEIDAPSQPDGLSEKDGVFHLQVGNGSFKIGSSKKVALEAHKALHETRLMPTPFSFVGMKEQQLRVKCLFQTVIGSKQTGGVCVLPCL